MGMLSWKYFIGLAIADRCLMTVRFGLKTSAFVFTRLQEAVTYALPVLDYRNGSLAMEVGCLVQEIWHLLALPLN